MDRVLVDQFESGDQELLDVVAELASDQFAVPTGPGC
jgi:hypothetical protein